MYINCRIDSRQLIDWFGPSPFAWLSTSRLSIYTAQTSSKNQPVGYVRSPFEIEPVHLKETKYTWRSYGNDEFQGTGWWRRCFLSQGYNQSLSSRVYWHIWFSGAGLLRRSWSRRLPHNRKNSVVHPLGALTGCWRRSQLLSNICVRRVRILVHSGASV